MVHLSYPQKSSSFLPPNCSVSDPLLTCRYCGLVNNSLSEVIPHLHHTPSAVLLLLHPLSLFSNQSIVPVPGSIWVPQPGPPAFGSSLLIQGPTPSPSISSPTPTSGQAYGACLTFLSGSAQAPLSPHWHHPHPPVPLQVCTLSPQQTQPAVVARQKSRLFFKLFIESCLLPRKYCPQEPI